jgi:signal transduction histidine kinase
LSRLPEEALVNVLDRLPNGVIVVDEREIVRYTNATARTLLTPFRVRVGSGLPETPSWDPSLHELWSRVFRLGLLRDVVLPVEGRTLRLSGVVDRHDHLATLVFDDISARARRLRTEEDFAVNVAHEILSPIAAIAGAAQVLQDGGKDDPDARERFIGHIAAASERVTMTATAMLVLARAENGLGGPRLELVPLRGVLEEIRRGREDVSVSCPEKVAVLADVDLLRQAISVLVENARRHSPAGIGITVDDGGETVAVNVVDQGSGILPENLERVTDRFFSAGGDSRGYGVGLSIAVRAAKVLGGTLDVSSDRSGTSARLQLPSARLL